MRLNRGAHENSHLQRAWNLYGDNAFQLRVLEQIENPAHLLEREQFYLDTLQPEYNISPTAGNCLGIKHSEETRHKLSVIRKGKKRAPYSAEALRHFSEAMKRRVLTPEERGKISQYHKGRPQTEEHKRKRREAQPRPAAKLTEQEVAEIRVLLEEGVLPQREIAARYNVARTSISHIKHGHTWREPAA